LEEKMPGKDRTGPLGQGPMTGLGFGFCGGRTFDRRGLSRGFGPGRMWISQVKPVELTKDEERKILEAELRELEEEKKEIENVLKNLK
jgi:hypothetical protein